MAIAGSLTYDTKIDKNGFEKGLNSLKNKTSTVGGQIKSIIAALGIGKLVSAGFNIINNSIDGAISRIDTLNNYPKVMSNLGISAEDAQKSITKMSDKLAGLPTTLDEGALSVQRFTSANGDINKSTDYFLALNNAILAGGASADIQSTALEQLSQAYAKGKPDMMEWRSIQTAMPAQLNQVAKAFNMTSDELGEALRNGKISMDDFMTKIVELNENGSNGFQSFEQQAKNSTGGIATSIKVAKTQVVKGVADVIMAFDQLLKDEGLGGISSIISDIGKKAKEVLSMFAQNLPSIVAKIKQTIPLIVEKMKQLAPLIVTVVSALVAYKATLIAITAIQFAQKIGSLVLGFIKLIPAIKSVKDAMILLNVAFGINPIALIIAAIAALVAAFIYLWKTNEDFRNFWINMWEKIKTTTLEAFEKVKQCCNKIIDFFKNNWKGLLLLLVSPFAGAFKLIYDNCEDFRNAIESFVQKIKDFFAKDIPNAFKTLKEKIVKIGNDIGSFFEELWTSIINFFTKTIPKWINSAIDWFNKLPYNIGYIFGTLLGRVIKFGQDCWNWVTVELPKIIKGVIDWFATLPGKIKIWLDNAINNVIVWGVNLYNIITEKVRTSINSAITFFSLLPGRIWNFLVDTINKMNLWVQNLYQRASSGASNAVRTIINTISQLPGKMWAHLSSALSRVSQFASSMTSKARAGASNAVSAIRAVFKALPAQMVAIGKDIIRGIWNGMKSMKGWIKQQAKSMAQGMLDVMKGALGIHSPSTLFRDEIGKFIPQGIAIGIVADTDKAINAIRAMDNEIIREVNKAVALETGAINTNANIRANNNTEFVGVSLKNNQPIVVNSVLELDGKVAATTVNKANAIQKLAYGV